MIGFANETYNFVICHCWTKTNTIPNSFSDKSPQAKIPIILLLFVNSLIMEVKQGKLIILSTQNSYLKCAN